MKYTTTQTIELTEYKLTRPFCHTLTVRGEEWRLFSVGATWIAENQTTKALLSSHHIDDLVALVVGGRVVRAD